MFLCLSIVIAAIILAIPLTEAADALRDIHDILRRGGV